MNNYYHLNTQSPGLFRELAEVLFDSQSVSPQPVECIEQALRRGYHLGWQARGEAPTIGSQLRDKIKKELEPDPPILAEVKEPHVRRIKGSV